jgi:signal transduction histidine kinase
MAVSQAASLQLAPDAAGGPAALDDETRQGFPASILIVDDLEANLRQGLGLGLAIEKGIIDADGSRIGVESRVGAGSRFLFICRP